MRVAKINNTVPSSRNIIKQVAQASHTGVMIANRAAKQNHKNMLSTFALKCYSIGKKVFKAVPGGPFAKACTVIGLFSPIPLSIFAGFFLGNSIDYIIDKVKSKTS